MALGGRDTGCGHCRVDAARALRGRRQEGAGRDLVTVTAVPPLAGLGFAEGGRLSAGCAVPEASSVGEDAAGTRPGA
jgi:hypothetical protein